MRLLAIAFLALTLASACTDEAGARGTLEAEGFSEIRLTGYSPWSCGQGDGTCTGFVAVGPSGKRVSGAVGCGFMSCSKNCTLRIGHTVSP